MSTSTTLAPALHLIPVGLGAAPTPLWLPASVQDMARKIEVYIAENAKSARAFLQQISPLLPIQDITIFSLDKKEHSFAQISQWLSHPAASPHGVGLVSEAGCPAVADPGAAVVAAAHRLHIPVYPYVGPSSILLALMGSGLNGQKFYFQGYLPVRAAERRQAIQQLERQSALEQSTQLFIETPYRNQRLFDELCQSLHPQTQLCVARALTTEQQWLHTQSIEQWRQQTPPQLDKLPTLFLFLAAPQAAPNQAVAPQKRGHSTQRRGGAQNRSDQRRTRRQGRPAHTRRR